MSKSSQPRHPTNGRFVAKAPVKQGKAKPESKQQAPKGGQKPK